MDFLKIVYENRHKIIRGIEVLSEFYEVMVLAENDKLEAGRKPVPASRKRRKPVPRKRSGEEGGVE